MVKLGNGNDESNTFSNLLENLFLKNKKKIKKIINNKEKLQTKKDSCLNREKQVDRFGILNLS